MTRKHFIELAEMLGKSTKSNDDKLIEEMVIFCKKQNPRFNEFRFLDKIDEIRKG